MIDLTQNSDGVLLPIHAQPHARRNAVVGFHAGRLKIAVTQAPEKGKANAAILKLLASVLALRKSQLRLVSGATSPKKTVCVQGATVTEISKRLKQVLGSSTE